MGEDDPLWVGQILQLGRYKPLPLRTGPNPYTENNPPQQRNQEKHAHVIREFSNILASIT